MRTSTTEPANVTRGRRRIGRARLAAIAALIAAAALFGFARPARAGNYVVTQCSSITAFAEATFERSSDHYRQRAMCGTDAGLEVYHDADSTSLGRYGAWVWRAPAGTVFTDVQANASLTYQAGHHGELVAITPSGQQVGFGSEHNDFRVHSVHGVFTQFNALLSCVAPGAAGPVAEPAVTPRTPMSAASICGPRIRSRRSSRSRRLAARP